MYGYVYLLQFTEKIRQTFFPNASRKNAMDDGLLHFFRGDGRTMGALDVSYPQETDGQE